LGRKTLKINERPFPNVVAIVSFVKGDVAAPARTIPRRIKRRQQSCRTASPKLTGSFYLQSSLTFTQTPSPNRCHSWLFPAIIMVENAHKYLEHFREEKGREPTNAERVDVIILAAKKVGRPLFSPCWSSR
jgi:hypothetical protein